MKWLSSLIGSGVVAPMTGAAVEIIKSQGVTDQVIAYCKAIGQIASASWRPWLAKAIGICMIIYIFVSLLGIGYVLMMTPESFKASTSQLKLVVDSWKFLGGQLFTFGGIFLGVYGGGRSLEAITKNSNGKIGKAAQKVASVITGSKPEVERRAAHVPDAAIDKIEGVSAQLAAVDISPPRDPRKKYGWEWSSTSRRRFAGVNDDIVKLLTVALQYTPYDAGIAHLGGLRTSAQQQSLYDEEISPALNSRHLHGMALDVVMYDENQVYTTDWHYYETFYEAVEYASQITGIPFEWGGHWESRDGVHFQLPRDEYPDKVDVSL